MAVPGLAGTAKPAARKTAAAEQAQWRERIETILQRGSIGLLARLPHRDAVALASMAADGRTTWCEIYAALHALLKDVICDALGDTTPGEQSDETWAAYEAWEDTKQHGERTIWARYDAQCDAFFAGAGAPLGKGPRAVEELFRREQVLDGFRIERDNALADLARQMDSRPAQPAFAPPPAELYHVAVAALRPTTAETDATEMLRAAGFTASREMAGVIGALAIEIAGKIARVARLQFAKLEAVKSSA